MSAKSAEIEKEFRAKIAKTAKDLRRGCIQVVALVGKLHLGTRKLITYNR